MAAANLKIEKYEIEGESYWMVTNNGEMLYDYCETKAEATRAAKEWQRDRILEEIDRVIERASLERLERILEAVRGA